MKTDKWLKLCTAAGNDFHEATAGRINSGLWIDPSQKTLRGARWPWRLHGHLHGLARPVRAEVPYVISDPVMCGGKLRRSRQPGVVDAILEDGTLVDWKLFIGDIDLKRRLQTSGIPQWRRALYAFPEAPAFLYACFSAKPVFRGGEVRAFDLTQRKIVRMRRGPRNRQHVRRGLRRRWRRGLKKQARQG